MDERILSPLEWGELMFWLWHSTPMPVSKFGQSWPHSALLLLTLPMPSPAVH